jgi:GxxExxY protein
MSGGPVGLKHAELTERIIGIFYEVYNDLGYGFLESVYEESLVIALRERKKIRGNPYESVARVSA